MYRVCRGIKRQVGTAQNGAAPLLVTDLRAIVARLPGTTIGRRDRALLLVGFAGAFRHSELVGIDVADVELRDEGMVIAVRRSKTDQDGEGTTVGIPFGRDPSFCPVGALRAWLKASEVNEGPVFRPVDRHGHVADQRLSAAAVAGVVKRAVRMIGLEAGKYSGHSLRAGFATSAAMANVSDRVIMRQTRHRSVRVLERYIRDGSLFRENAAAAVL